MKRIKAYVRCCPPNVKAPPSLEKNSRAVNEYLFELASEYSSFRSRTPDFRVGRVTSLWLTTAAARFFGEGPADRVEFDDEVHVNGIVPHLIDDPVLARNGLSKTVIDEALEFSGDVAAFGKLTDVRDSLLELRRRLSPCLPPERSNYVTSQLIDADSGGRQDAVLQQRG
ncbi:hypothetical protein [Paraburkholderia largidicola]|uniref:hypothetical protein n=1 Tax=Paraburkholderia largidicola TaxID=3014751 RepID=UPI0015DAB1B9|nr:hypothetical protein [Paraburkholderia sp. PGU16]